MSEFMLPLPIIILLALNHYYHLSQWCFCLPVVEVTLCLWYVMGMKWNYSICLWFGMVLEWLSRRLNGLATGVTTVVKGCVIDRLCRRPGPHDDELPDSRPVGASALFDPKYFEPRYSCVALERTASFVRACFVTFVDFRCCFNNSWL